MAARSSLPDIAIVGLGNWGTSLAAALLSARVPLREVVVRKPRRSALPLVSWKSARLDARLIWLCVPDADIAALTEKIAARRPSLAGQIVVHSSGALAAVRRAGAKVASVHPAMTFPTRDVVPLDGILFGIEAEQAATRRLLHALVSRIGGTPFDLSSKDKPMYHAAGTLASPLLVSALTAALETARLAGLDAATARRWVQALAEPTVHNVFARGAEKSFSGPFARGDAETIRLHLNALQPHPIVAAVYRSLAQQALQSLPVKNARALSAALKAETQMKQAGRSGARTATRSQR